jgi:hypothetical protein
LLLLLSTGGCCTAGMTLTICTASVIQQCAHVLLPGWRDTIHMKSSGSPSLLPLLLAPAAAAAVVAAAGRGVILTTSMYVDSEGCRRCTVSAAAWPMRGE